MVCDSEFKASVGFRKSPHFSHRKKRDFYRHVFVKMDVIVEIKMKTQEISNWAWGWSEERVQGREGCRQNLGR